MTEAHVHEQLSRIFRSRVQRPIYCAAKL